MTMDVTAAAAALTGGAQPVSEMFMRLGECVLRIRSNSAELIAGLSDYFGHVVADPAPADMEILAVESPEPDLGLDFIDWAREPGKTGRKDSYVDFPGGRLVRKVRTGMVFLQSETHRIAAGPCRRYDNQVINFINSQYMNWLQNRSWLICHASGLVKNGACLGIAGFSGGGKSTLMLRILDDESVSYLTNDRLFVHGEDGVVRSRGIPKLPRINPGTIVHNPKLHGLMSDETRQAFLDMPPAELWGVEDKYDVHMDRVYGAGRIIDDAPLGAFLILNWQRDSAEETAVERVDLAERRELLGAIMKSPGPFYQYTNGHFLSDTTALDAAPYLEALRDVPIYEASGKVDFDLVTDEVLQRIMG